MSTDGDYESQPSFEEWAEKNNLIEEYNKKCKKGWEIPTEPPWDEIEKVSEAEDKEPGVI